MAIKKKSFSIIDIKKDNSLTLGVSIGCGYPFISLFFFGFNVVILLSK